MAEALKSARPPWAIAIENSTISRYGFNITERGCHEWLGPTAGNGYAIFSVNGRHIREGKSWKWLP